MAKMIPLQVNDADYDDGRVVIEAKSWWHNGQLDWAVPAWEEMGLGELEGPFPSRADAVAAIAGVARFLPEYGFTPVVAA